MTKFVAATYHADIKVAEFITDDGKHLLRAGGTLPWRINNCGDLSSPTKNGEPAPRFTRDFIGYAKVASKSNPDSYHFFIFPDYETGRAQLKASLKRKYSQSTIAETLKHYAPEGDDHPKEYAEFVLKSAGVADDAKICDLSDAQLDGVTLAIGKFEGYENVETPRRELLIPVSTIVVTDGVGPLSDEEVVLRINGKDRSVKTNTVGQLPPVVHDKGPVEVLHRTPDNELKSVGTISGDSGGHFILLTNFISWFGHSQPDNAPEGTTSRPQPMTYVVQPRDSLSKIAKRFNTTIEKIKQDNRQIKGDMIHPGDKLGIFGSAPEAGNAKAQPKKSGQKPVASAASSASAAPAGKKRPPPAQAARSARSDAGAGKPLTIVPMEQGRVPWMRYVVAEAKRWKGTQEDAIMSKGTNYHTLIGDTLKTMSSKAKTEANAWCAAFANWCLSQAGYAIDTGIWRARARAIYSHDDPGGKKTLTQNPLFVEIDTPIYGAIVVVTSRSGNSGHHVAFVYARQSKTQLVLIGGNQSDRISFANYHTDDPHDKLLFFVPAAYLAQASKEIAADDLPAGNGLDLDKEFEIDMTKAVAGKEK